MFIVLLIFKNKANMPRSHSIFCWRRYNIGIEEPDWNPKRRQLLIKPVEILGYLALSHLVQYNFIPMVFLVFNLTLNHNIYYSYNHYTCYYLRITELV